jgi:anti-sigma factor RsiW
MKEQLESNLITKYAAGLMSSEEMKHLEEWLKKNPQYNVTVAIIKQQVDALVNAAGRVMV